MTKTPKQALIDARALIEKGWTQGRYFDDAKNAFCASGAIGEASGAWNDDGGNNRTHIGTEPWQIFSDVVKGPENLSIPIWNDTPGRTKEEVLAAFDTAIKKAS
jgi:hypothetical protein